jgi:hypothetical protein
MALASSPVAAWKTTPPVGVVSNTPSMIARIEHRPAAFGLAAAAFALRALLLRQLALHDEPVVAGQLLVRAKPAPSRGTGDALRRQ